MQTGDSSARIAVTRAQIVKTAREYVGTPFQHQGRRNGLGLDCVGLILCVGDDLGLIDRNGAPFRRSDSLDYAPMPTGREVHDEARRRLIEKSMTEQLLPGDVLTIRLPHLPTHAAIVADRQDKLYMIHAYSVGPKQCVEHILSGGWLRRVVGAFSFPGVTA